MDTGHAGFYPMGVFSHARMTAGAGRHRRHHVWRRLDWGRRHDGRLSADDTGI